MQVASTYCLACGGRDHVELNCPTVNVPVENGRNSNWREKRARRELHRPHVDPRTMIETVD